MLEIQQKKSNVRISTLEYTPCIHHLCMSTKFAIAIGHLSVAFAPPLQRKQYGRKSNNELKLHWNCVYQLPVHSRIDIVTVQIASSQAPAGRNFLINSSKISYAPFDKEVEESFKFADVVQRPASLKQFMLVPAFLRVWFETDENTVTWTCRRVYFEDHNQLASSRTLFVTQAHMPFILNIHILFILYIATVPHPQYCGESVFSASLFQVQAQCRSLDARTCLPESFDITMPQHWECRNLLTLPC